jgi:hypothetical protein
MTVIWNAKRMFDMNFFKLPSVGVCWLDAALAFVILLPTTE